MSQPHLLPRQWSSVTSQVGVSVKAENVTGYFVQMSWQKYHKPHFTEKSTWQMCRNTFARITEKEWIIYLNGFVRKRWEPVQLDHKRISSVCLVQSTVLQLSLPWVAAISRPLVRKWPRRRQAQERQEYIGQSVRTESPPRTNITSNHQNNLKSGRKLKRQNTFAAPSSVDQLNLTGTTNKFLLCLGGIR